MLRGASRRKFASFPNGFPSNGGPTDFVSWCDFSLCFLMLFHRNRLPTSHPPFPPFSICFHIESDQIWMVSSPLPDFAISLVFLMLFHRSFVSGDSRRFSWGSALSEPSLWSSGCPDFAVFPIVFHRIDDNLEGGLSSVSNSQFR